MTQKLLAPKPISAEHSTKDFSCGEVLLDEWLRQRALPNQLTGASRTFVVTNGSGQVVGYYAIATGSVSHQEAARNIRRNMPDPVPVIVLGRLAVDQDYQGRQLGGALLQDALQRTVNVAQNVGVRALLVHALNDHAREFYIHYGFTPSPLNPMTLMLPLNAKKTH